jgi:hypothetical protein
MSIGGPPKAVLGGPQRKVSPNPAVAAATANLLKKKFNVNLPKETEAVDGEGDDAGDAEKQAEEQTQEQAATSKNRVSKEWARVPISVAEGEARMSSYAPLSDDELVSREPFPPEEWRKGLPLSIDVFLPGKVRTSVGTRLCLRTHASVYRQPGTLLSSKSSKPNSRSLVLSVVLVATILIYTRRTHELPRYVFV